LRPGGVPQERAYGFPGPAASVGPPALVTALVHAAQPLSAEVRSLHL